MFRFIGHALFGLVTVIVLLGLILATFSVFTVRQSFPRTSGEIQLAGLDAPVDVHRDAAGIPHIYATTKHDLFFAQGYVHAQDRFFQMDFWRHTGSGRLSELFGAGQVETDQFLRTLGWARVAQQELAILDADTRTILEDYAGVNAYLADHQGSALSLEYPVLKLVNPDYTPEPWTPLHSLTWGKVMAWDLGSNMNAEITRAILSKTLSPELLADILERHQVCRGGLRAIAAHDRRSRQPGEFAGHSYDRAIRARLSPPLCGYGGPVADDRISSAAVGAKPGGAGSPPPPEACKTKIIRIC